MSDEPPLISPAGSKGSTTKCQVCRIKQAKYTCPACNLRYCSLDCFKSEQHSNCSETFYKESLLNEVKGRNDVGKEEKAKILNMLQRLEDSEKKFGLSDDDADDDLLDTGADSLRAALQDLDIDAISPEQLLSMLTPEQRKEFEEILKDPGKAADLLNSGPEVIRVLWWEDTDGNEDRESKSEGRAPTPVATSKLLAVASEAPLELGHNLLAIIIGYVFYSRITDLEETMEEKQSMLIQLLPFLAEKSTLKLSTLGEAIDYVLSNVREDIIADQKKLVLLLLKDLLNILPRPRVALVEQQHSNDKTFLVLSDLYSIFTSTSAGTKKRRFPLAAPKILFYLSNLERIQRQGLLREIERYTEKLQQERHEDVTLANSASEPLLASNARAKNASERTRPKIEEIP